MQLALARPLDWPWRSALVTQWGAFGVVAALAVGVILWLGRDLTFAGDECVYITRGWDVLAPLNEHPAVVPMAVWQTLQATFGLGSYLPFLLALMVLHVALAAGIYALLGGIMGLGSAALMLFLGSAASQLFWAVQISFVASAVTGVAALLALERGRTGLTAVLLTVSILSSGMGLPFLGTAVVYGLVTRRGWWLVIPVAVYGAWLLAFGRSGLTSHTNPLDHVTRVPRIIGEQVIDSLGALSGLPGIAVLAVLLVAAAVMAWRGWRPSPMTLACMAGIVGLFIIVGLVRDTGYSDRYQTSFAALALIGIGRMPWPRWIIPFGLLFAWALFTNVGGMLNYPHEWALWAPGRTC